MRLALYDDDVNEVRYRVIQLSQYFTPTPIEDPAPSIGELIDVVTNSADALLIDNDLQSTFDGCQVVAALYDQNFPAVLYSAYYALDADLQVRELRRRVPVFLSKSDARQPEAVQRAFERVDAELRGDVPADRRGHRTILTIARKSEESGRDVLDVSLASWNPETAVRLPLSILPAEIQPQAIVGARFIATVNTAAEREEDLFFDELEVAPPPMELQLD